MKDVIFVLMPFASIHRPSLGLSTLTATLKKNLLDAKVLYGNLLFAKKVSLEVYEDICESSSTTLLAESIFAPHAYPEASHKQKKFENFFKNGYIELPSKRRLAIDDFMTARSSVEQYLDQLKTMILKSKPIIVGLSSIFQQTCASVAIANILKSVKPEIVTVLGGSNCMKPMGESLLEITPSIDYVFSGEADFDFINFCSKILKGNSPKKRFIDCKPIKNLNRLPYPDYSDYFKQKRQLGYTDKNWIAFETSRGCWWGQKSHCSFCGLNGRTLKYREKNKRRIEEEIQFMLSEYKPQYIQATDNIMPNRFPYDGLKGLNYFKELKSLYYEVRPILSFRKLLELKNNGINYFQPGIETLNTRLLKLMRKALLASNNIRFLRDCKTVGILPGWNFLHSIPEEREEDYVGMINVIPYLYHLAPPFHAGPLYIQRFSPLFEEAEKYKISNLRPASAYSYIYPEKTNLQNVALYFEGDYKVAFENRKLKADFLSVILEWQKLWDDKPPNLLLVGLKDGYYLVEDTRPISNSRFQIITRKHFAVLRRIREPVREFELRSFLKNEELDEVFAELMSWGYIIKIDKKFLSLINEPMRVTDMTGNASD